MIIGFLGALIGLERAVALDRLWPYGIPMLSGISALSALWGGLFNTLTILLFLINNIRVKVGATEELGHFEYGYNKTVELLSKGDEQKERVQKATLFLLALASSIQGRT